MSERPPGTFNKIVTHFVFVTVLFVGLTVAGLFVLRRRRGDAAYTTPGFPLTPAFFLRLIVVLLFLLAARARLTSAQKAGYDVDSDYSARGS